MKSAQAWGFDLVVGLMLFSIGIVAFYLYSINYAGGSETDYPALQEEAKLIADVLMTSGYPLDWDSDNVVRIGINDDGKINQTKLERFYYLSLNDYEKTKNLFNVRNDYYVRFSGNVSVDGESVGEIGRVESGSENLVKVSRAVIYENKIWTMEVFVWN